MTYRLLLIDDDPDQRILLRHAFAKSDLFQVVAEAATAEDAVTEVNRSSPDVILLDLMLAGRDGLELLPTLRDRCPGAQIVVLSGLPRNEFEFAVSAGGAVGYLEKDISPLALPDALLAVAGVLDVVSEVLDRASANLDHHPSSPGTARRFVAEVLRRWQCEDALGAVELAVSELVTNAIVHASSSVDITVSLRPRDVRVDVVDRGSGRPQIRTQAETGDSGRGLVIVQSLATSWGIDEGPGWKSVWFLVPRPDVPNASSSVDGDPSVTST
jgi:DNA-binding NarL/FixJ family response regulator